MSLSVRTQGGTGGMTASIFMTGLSETDTVTASNGLETKVAVWNSTESRHEITGIVDKGRWTVTATNGERTETQDVLVDGAFEYEIEMSYKLWLYREGDECEDVTGGWSANGYTYGVRDSNGNIITYSVGAGTKNADSLYMAGPGTSYTIQIFGTAKVIDFSNYKKLFVDANHQGNSGTRILLSTSKGIVEPDTVIRSQLDIVGRTVYELSLDDLGVSEARFISFDAVTQVSRTLTVYNVWLE